MLTVAAGVLPWYNYWLDYMLEAKKAFCGSDETVVWNFQSRFLDVYGVFHFEKISVFHSIWLNVKRLFRNYFSVCFYLGECLQRNGNDRYGYDECIHKFFWSTPTQILCWRRTKRNWLWRTQKLFCVPSKQNGDSTLNKLWNSYPVWTKMSENFSFWKLNSQMFLFSKHNLKKETQQYKEMLKYINKPHFTV